MFIYLITNTVNGKYYVGKWAGPRLQNRWRCHLTEVRRGSHTALHNAIRKYGPAAFLIEPIGEAPTVEELSHLERLWILVLQATDRKRGYNISAGGDGASYKRSAATKRRIAAARRALYRNPAVRQQQVDLCRMISKIPKKFTPAGLVSLSASGRRRRGEKRSAKARANMSAARLAYFETEKGKATKRLLQATKGNGNLGARRRLVTPPR